MEFGSPCSGQVKAPELTHRFNTLVVCLQTVLLKCINDEDKDNADDHSRVKESSQKFDNVFEVIRVQIDVNCKGCWQGQRQTLLVEVSTSDLGLSKEYPKASCSCFPAAP